MGGIFARHRGCAQAPITVAIGTSIGWVHAAGRNQMSITSCFGSQGTGPALRRQFESSGCSMLLTCHAWYAVCGNSCFRLDFRHRSWVTLALQSPSAISTVPSPVKPGTMFGIVLGWCQSPWVCREIDTVWRVLYDRHISGPLRE